MATRPVFGIAHSVSVTRTDGVSFSGARRMRVVLHPRQSYVVDRRENGRCVWIKYCRRHGKLPVSPFGYRWPHDLDRGDRRKVSAMRRDSAFIAAAPLTVRRTPPQKVLQHVWREGERTDFCPVAGKAIRSSSRMRHNESNHEEEQRMRNQRSGLGSSRPRRFVKLQQMDRRAVRRGWPEPSGGEQVTRVFANAPDPRFSKGSRTGWRAYEWLAHGQTSVSASRSRPANE